MTWYWPLPTRPVDQGTGELADLANTYGAGGQLAQALAAALGSPGLSASAAMDYVRSVLALPVFPEVNYGNLFGDGSDGVATLDGVATVAWASKAGSVYTLTRNAKLTSLTINNGVTLNTGPGRWLVFCRGTVTINPGGIIDASGGAGQANGTAGASQGSGTLAGGRAGGAGNTGAGSAGTSQANAIGLGSAGAGGAGSAGAGGAAGTVTNVASVANMAVPPVLGVAAVFANVFVVGGGPGGGGGTGDNTNKGGGGGAGGGPIFVVAWALVNNGTIQAPGGAGGTPATGNCGGGGGGSGGLVLVYTLTAVTGSGSVNVAPGGAGSGVGTGAAGSAGSAGAQLFQVLN